MSGSELYFNPDLETMSQDEIVALQNERLKEKVRYVMANNAYLRDLYTKAGVVAEDFRGIEDIEKLPILAKANFRETYPLGMCCVPKNLIREMHMSSGSTGTPVVMPYTIADLEQWAACITAQGPQVCLLFRPALGIQNVRSVWREILIRVSSAPLSPIPAV